MGDTEDRRAKFKTLQKRATESATANKKEVYQENSRRKNGVITKQQQQQEERKREEAEMELAKLEAEETGEDFERKRAWDWTVEEVEEWDRKQQAKQNAKEAAQNPDLGDQAHRAYQKDLQQLEPDAEEYEKQKGKRISQGLLVKDNEGNVVNYDTVTDDGADFVTHKPSKQAVDRVVKGLKKNDERKMKRRKQNYGEHVTWINDANKRYTRQLDQHYNKYNKDVRDAFERGSAL